MHFILAPESIEKLSNLRTAYEAERHVHLDSKPSIFGLPTLFGGTDVIARRNQISFLEKINAVLGRFLLKDHEITTSQQLQAKLMGSRILIAACLYVQMEINSSKEKSALYRLINQFLGVTSVNFLDNEDKESCYSTAFKLVNQLDVCSHLNAELRTLGKKEFSKEEWELFSSFISKESHKKEAPKAPRTSYPVTSFIQPFFESAFAFVGSTIGSVVANVVNASSATIARRLQLSSLIGGGALLLIGPASAAGIALIAPTIAERLISTFCTNSITTISGKTMGLVGIGAGTIVSLPLDLAYNFIRATGSLLVSYTSEENTFAPLDGIRLADGVLMAKGNPIRFNLIPQCELDTRDKFLEIKESGEITLDGKPIKDPGNAMATALRELNSATSKALPMVEGEPHSNALLAEINLSENCMMTRCRSASSSK